MIDSLSMKKNMESLEIAAVVREMDDLVGGFVQKVYAPGKNTVSFRIHVPGTGKHQLVFKVGNALYLSEKEIKNPRSPGDYVMLMRKILGNSRITNIYQNELDRVVVIEMQGKERFKLIFEVFGKGNLILVGENKIILPYRSESWKHRDLKKGEVYRFPPARQNPFEMTFDEIKETMLSSSSDLVRTLAVPINLGGKYAEEVCARLGVDKETKDLEDLVVGVYEILQEIKSSLFVDELEPLVVKENEKIIDVVPFPLKKYETFEKESIGSYNEALDLAFVPVEEEGSEVGSRLDRKLKTQKEALEKMKKREIECKKKAELIYQNYRICEELLEAILEAREKDIEDNIFPKLLESNQISRIDREGQFVTVKLRGEVDGEEYYEEVKLDFREDVNGNASRYYDESKKARKKKEGAIKAITYTKEELKRSKEAVEERRIEKKPTAPFWFDRYKWFLSSQGILVVAGLDAKTNEEVVKKYLEKGGRYAHAEAGGAPSVVVRKGDGNIGEDTLKEACQFSLVHSKEWKRGIAAGTAYWVKPQQVSKTAEAGESLPTGAFVIRGKRNYVKDIPMEAVLIEVEYKGKRKVTCAPSWTLKNSDYEGKKVRFRPGNTPLGSFSKEMSDHFSVPIEEVQRLLPPGDVKIMEKS